MPVIRIDWSDDFDRIEQKLDAVLTALGTVLDMEVAQMADLSAIQQEVTDNADTTQAAITLLQGLAQMVRDNATDQTALNALADQLDSQSQALADAVVANTPAAAPAPGEAPTP